MPDLLDYMTNLNHNMTVKSGHLTIPSDIKTQTMEQYREQVYANYSSGTFRFGPLHQLSLVGTVHEESGGYFPKFLSLLEESPFLNLTMPWGALSICHGDDPHNSNDGPIMWVRPGEQMIPTAGTRTRRRNKELENLKCRYTEGRELLFEDRTKAHADHVGHGLERITSAAVGKNPFDFLNAFINNFPMELKIALVNSLTKLRQIVFLNFGQHTIAIHFSHHGSTL